MPHSTQKDENNGPFKLFCDDSGPGNVLVDGSTLKITAVIDWEFCYAGPAQFLASPPKWLLLKPPDHWVEDDGLKNFLKSYMPKLDLFLRSLEKEEREEEEEEARGAGPGCQRRLCLIGYVSQRKTEPCGLTWRFEMAGASILSIGICLITTSTAHARLTNRSQGRPAMANFTGIVNTFVRSKIEELQQYRLKAGNNEKASYQETEPDEKPRYWVEREVYYIYTRNPCCFISHKISWHLVY